MPAIETERERRKRRRRAIRNAERTAKHCAKCGLRGRHVCLYGDPWARLDNPEPARVAR